MASLSSAMASSHAYALREPVTWDKARRENMRGYERTYGVLPQVNPHIADEPDDVVETRYARIRDAFRSVRTTLAETRPDVLLIVADDQNEHFTSIIPQIAIYVGKQFMAGSRTSAGVCTASHPRLAEAILQTAVDADIDIAAVRELPDERLFAHAFAVLHKIDPEATLPVIPVFVNAIHVPAPSPARCYYFGQTIRRAIEQFPGSERVALYASGGLSHFTKGYPWKRYAGPFGYGAISEDFDRELVERLSSGDSDSLARLTSQDLLANGEIEVRSWITLLGAVGQVRPEFVVYEPFYRGLMGMAVASWDIQARQAVE